MEKRGVCLRRDLVRIRCCVVLQRSQTANYAGSSALLAPARQISGYSPAYDSRTALTWIPLCYLFFVASLSAFLSAFCWLPLFLLQRLSGLNCWSSHQWYSVDSRKSCCWLVKMVFVEWADKFSKVLDHWGWLPGVFFLRVSFSWNQIVET